MKTSKRSTASNRILLFSFYLLVFSLSAFACGPCYYSAADNRIYRLLPPIEPAPAHHDDFRTKNIKAWARQTGCSDTAAIRQAVYQGSLADWEKLYNSRILNRINDANVRKDEWFYPNSFVRCIQYLHKDKEAVRILYWSKLYENIRNQQRSPWYYNSRIESDESRQLRKLYDEVRRFKPSKKYADRHAFLALKCAWAVEEDSAAVALWKRSQLNRKGNLFNAEAKDYTARCLERLGRESEANDLYRSNDNYYELIPYDASLPTKMHIMLQVVPNSKQIKPLLQDYLTDLDREHAYTYRFDDSWLKTDSMLLVARSAIDNPQVRHKDMWRYFAACVLDYNGHSREALAQLRGAEKGDGDAFLRQSVRVLTFYLRARTETIDDDFERYAVQEIKWLDNEALREWKTLPEDIRQDIQQTRNLRWSLKINQLFAYSTLRRIILEDSVGLAWRMAEAGREVRALQMANLADNHILIFSQNKVIDVLRHSDDSVFSVWYERNNGEYNFTTISSLNDTATLDGHSFGFWTERDNSHDYSNGLFVVADGLSARSIAEYHRRQLSPLDATDRWFNARSYNNSDYWLDIIGTHYLRERNYSAAVSYLRYISPSYQSRMNINEYFIHDPFGFAHLQPNTDSTHYKLHFAQHMDSLQRIMRSHPDPDSCALAMLEYTIGLENSFNMCWGITSYQKGWTGPNLIDIDQTVYAQQAQREVKSLRKKALAMLLTDDAHARYHLRLGHFTIVRKRYANTPTAQQLALVCDHRGQYLSWSNNETEADPDALLRHYLLPEAYERHLRPHHI